MGWRPSSKHQEVRGNELVVQIGSLNKSKGVRKGGHLGKVELTEFGDQLVPENGDKAGVPDWSPGCT